MSGSNSEWNSPILTPSQQEFLESGYNVGGGTSNERVKRSRIRERIRNAITEFAFIANRLEPEDRDMIFELTGEQSDASLYYGIRKMIEFAYLGCSDMVDFERLLEASLYEAEVSRHRLSGTTVNVDLDLSITTQQHYDLDDAEDKFHNGEPLSFEEIGALMASGRVDDDEMEYLSELAQNQGYTPNFSMRMIHSLDDFLKPGVDPETDLG